MFFFPFPVGGLYSGVPSPPLAPQRKERLLLCSTRRATVGRQLSGGDQGGTVVGPRIGCEKTMGKPRQNHRNLKDVWTVFSRNESNYKWWNFQLPGSYLIGVFFFADPPSYLEPTLGHVWGISGAVVETGLWCCQTTPSGTVMRCAPNSRQCTGWCQLTIARRREH